MTEKEWMLKNGKIYTEKQYKMFFFKCISLAILAGFLTVFGLMNIPDSQTGQINILGVIIFVIGIILLAIYVLILFKHAVKLQLSKLCIKHPEEFSGEFKENEL